MISLQKLKPDRTKGADRIVIPKTVLENNIDNVTYEETLQVLHNRQFPFNRCIIEIEDDCPMYFEAVTENEVAFIQNVKTNGVCFSAAINLNTIEIHRTLTNYTYKVPDIRAAAFRHEKRVRLSTEQDERLKKDIAFELISILCIFAYINRVCLAEPELETKTVKKHAKKVRKGGNPVRYISTRKYVLTGQERKSRRGIPKVYTREQWQVRGHWRTYKSGKCVWIKPHEVKRDKEKLHGKKEDQRVYKVGI